MTKRQYVKNAVEEGGSSSWAKKVWDLKKGLREGKYEDTPEEIEAFLKSRKTTKK